MAKVNGTGKILTKGDLISRDNLKKELVEITELGGSVYLRELSTEKMIFYNSRIADMKSNVSGDEVTPQQSMELMTLLVSLSACDEAGQLLFTEEEARSLMQNSINVVTFLGTEVLRISGLSDKATKIAEDLKKTPTVSLPIN